MAIMTLKQAKDKVIKLINNYSSSGEVTAAGDLLDYTLRMNVLFDVYQKQVATVKRIHAVKKISQNPITNQLPNPLYMFDVVQHLGADLTYQAKGSKSYYFEVDGICDVYVEEQVGTTWQALPTPINISVTAKPDGFMAYSGLITALSSANNIRIRFSGNYPYNIRYIALYGYSFPSVSAIPPFTRYNLYTMPTDFYQLNKVVFKGNQSDGYPYVNTADFYWEGRDVIAINYYNKGEYSIFYYRYPTTIDDTTPDAYVFEVDEDAAQALPFAVAADMFRDESSGISDRFMALYNNALVNLDTKISNGSTSVSNSLFTGDSSSKLF